MDIETVIEAKRQCESEIRAILLTFEQQTGLVVERIGIDRAFQSIGFPAEIVGLRLVVKMDVRLKD